MDAYVFIRMYLCIYTRATPLQSTLDRVATRAAIARCNTPQHSGPVLERRTIGSTRVHVVANRNGAKQVFGLAVPAILIYVIGFQLGKVRVPIGRSPQSEYPLRVPGARWQVVVVYNVARSGKLQDPDMLAKYVPRVPP